VPNLPGIIASSYVSVPSYDPTYRSSAHAEWSGSGTSVSVNPASSFGTAPVAGDLVVAIVSFGYNDEDGGTGSFPAGWTLFSSGLNQGGIYYRTAASGDTTTQYTWSGGSLWQYATLSFVAVSNAQAIDAVNTTSDFSGTTHTLSGTASTNKDLLIGFWTGMYSGGTVTKPASMTLAYSISYSQSGTSTLQMMAYEKLSSSGSVSRDATTSVSQQSVNLAVLVK